MIAKRAWLYCRVASGWNADATDYLNLQKIQLEQFCQEHDLTIAGTTMVTGNGKSEIQELVQRGIEQDSFDVLVTVGMSRVGRDVLDILRLEDALSEHEKGFCFVKENHCTLPGLIPEHTQESNSFYEIGGLSL